MEGHDDNRNRSENCDLTGSTDHPDEIAVGLELLRYSMV